MMKKVNLNTFIKSKDDSNEVIFTSGHLNVDALKKTVSDMLDRRENKKRERDNKREKQIIVISEVTQYKFNQVIWSMGLAIVEGDAPETTKVFQAYNWKQRSKSDAISDACEHIQFQLSECGCRFGREGYKLLDIHTNEHLLDFSNKKVGSFSGGSDIAVVPYKTNMFGAQFQLCILFELKTNEQVLSNGGLDSFSSQAILKLIASWCLSHQRVMVVLTDLCSTAVVYEFEFIKKSNSFVIIQYDVTLCEMAELVVNFISNSTVPDAAYIPIDDNEISMPKLSFKRLKLAPFENIALDTFLDFGRYLPPGSEERCQMVSDIFSSLNDSQDID